MAKDNQAQQHIVELMENAEAYLTDAEFREETEERQMRYFQAMSTLLMAIANQNQLIISLLQEQGLTRRPAP